MARAFGRRDFEGQQGNNAGPQGTQPVRGDPLPHRGGPHLAAVHQQDQLPQLLQDEDQHHLWNHPHDVWNHSQPLESQVSLVMQFEKNSCVFFSLKKLFFFITRYDAL